MIAIPPEAILIVLAKCLSIERIETLFNQVVDIDRHEQSSHQQEGRPEMIDSHISTLQDEQIEEARTQKQHLELHESLEKEIFPHGCFEQVLALSDRQQTSDHLPDKRIEYAKNGREDHNKPQHHHKQDVVNMSAIIESDSDISFKKFVLHLLSLLSSGFCADKGSNNDGKTTGKK